MSVPIGETIRQAQNGHETAIEQLIARFGFIIEKECEKFGHRDHPEWTHSDSQQEALIHVLTHIDQFRSTDASNPGAAFEQWVRMTTRNFLRNLERDRKAKKRHPETGINSYDDDAAQSDGLRVASKTPSSIFARDEESIRIRAALDRLPQDHQEVLRLRVIEGLSLKQISSQLSLTYDQVRYKYNQSLSQIQGFLDEH